MKIIVLLSFLFIANKACPQDSLRKQRIDSVIQVINALTLLKDFEDTTGFYGSTDGTTVKGYYMNSFFYDSLHQLKKIKATIPVGETETVRQLCSHREFYFNDGRLIKALVFRDDIDSAYYYNYVAERKSEKRPRSSGTPVPEPKPLVFYYSSDDNILAGKTKSEMMAARPGQQKFLQNLLLGIKLMKQGLQN